MFKVIVCLLTAALAVSACNDRKPPWVDLPTAENLSYRVSLRTYQDGDYADQPFELRVTSKDGYTAFTALRASQCQNVQVGQTPSHLYVFYDHLALRGFLSGFHGRRPRPLLCDLDHELCRAMLSYLLKEKYIVTPVCTDTRPEVHAGSDPAPAAATGEATPRP